MTWLGRIIALVVLLTTIVVDYFVVAYIRFIPRNLPFAVIIAAVNVQAVYLINGWLRYPGEHTKER